MRTEAEAREIRRNAGVLIAVVVAAWLGWWAYGEFAEPEACGYQPDPDATPVECVLAYSIWFDLTFPHQRYIDEFSLTTDDTQLFEACTASYLHPYGSVSGWALATEEAGTDVSERVVDACVAWVDLNF